MRWVVDTCIILDILENHPIFGGSSADALDDLRDRGFCIAPITYVELAPAFNGDAEAQNEFLDELEVSRDFQDDAAIVLKAHRAWYEHILRKRTGEMVKRPIADVMIGAYALAKGGLITRNEADFKTLYPSLRVYNPMAEEKAISFD